MLQRLRDTQREVVKDRTGHLWNGIPKYFDNPGTNIEPKSITVINATNMAIMAKSMVFNGLLFYTESKEYQQQNTENGDHNASVGPESTQPTVSE